MKIYMVISNKYTETLSKGGTRYPHHFALGELVLDAPEYSRDSREGIGGWHWGVDRRDLYYIGEL